MQMSSKIWVKVQGVGVSWVNIYGAVCEPLFSLGLGVHEFCRHRHQR